MLKTLSLVLGLALPFSKAPVEEQPSCIARCLILFSITTNSMGHDLTDELVQVQTGYTEPHLTVSWVNSISNFGECKITGMGCVKERHCDYAGDVTVISTNATTLNLYGFPSGDVTTLEGTYAVDECGEKDEAAFTVGSDSSFAVIVDIAGNDLNVVNFNFTCTSCTDA